MTEEKKCLFCGKVNTDINATFCMYCGNVLNLESGNNQNYSYSTEPPKPTYTYGSDIPQTTGSETQRVYLGQNKLAMVSFIFGILGLFIIPGLGGFIAIILGIISFSEKKPGYQVAISGIIIGVFSIIFAAVLGVMFWMIFRFSSPFII
ncbi:MAG TPA: DUF4190 domain-containing protein [Candidatus Bathyarchaeia archaeon]|nr:DUF4190 domain-containing protein [Candidatus Bathyarchaeia archaeon]